MSLTCTLNIVGEITPPCGTPAITEPVLERTPGSLTCCILLVRKLRHHFKNDLLTPIPASFVSKIPWSTKSKALQKSTNNACTPLNELPWSVALYQSCLMLASAVTVDLPLVNACCEALILRSLWLSFNCVFSRTLATCGSTEICLKSVFMSAGLVTFGTGLMSACL